MTVLKLWEHSWNTGRRKYLLRVGCVFPCLLILMCRCVCYTWKRCVSLVLNSFAFNHISPSWFLPGQYIAPVVYFSQESRSPYSVNGEALWPCIESQEIYMHVCFYFKVHIFCFSFQLTEIISTVEWLTLTDWHYQRGANGPCLWSQCLGDRSREISISLSLTLSIKHISDQPGLQRKTLSQNETK